MGVVGSASRPGRFTPRKDPIQNCIGGWVGPWGRLNGCAKSRPHRDSIPGPSLSVKFVNISQKITEYFDTHCNIPPPYLSTRFTFDNNRDIQSKKIDNRCLLKVDTLSLHSRMLDRQLFLRPQLVRRT